MANPAVKTNDSAYRDSIGSARPGGPSRWVVIVIGAMLALAGATALAGSAWPIVLTLIPLEGIWALLWMMAMSGIGATALRTVTKSFGNNDPASPVASWFDAAPRSLQLVTVTAFGAGLTSLLVLLLGLAGLLLPLTAWAIVVFGSVVALIKLARAPRRAALHSWLTAPAGADAAMLVGVIPLAIVLVAACVVPGLLWGGEPNGYDVVEYHLQIPREWYELGRIVPLAHNVFSYFPFNVEMQSLLAMHLRGGPWKGMYLAQFMNVGLMGLFVMSIYGALRSRGRANAVIGALLAATTPWTVLLAPIAYNESGLLLFGTLAIVWALRGANVMKESKRGALALMALAGVFAGFAIGTKLTAAPLIAAGVPLCLLLSRPASYRKLLPPLVLFGVTCVLAASPWLIRNAAWTGNPLFPEATSLFGRGPFSQVQQQRWSAAHSATADQQTVGARLGALIGQVLIDIDPEGSEPGGSRFEYRQYFGLLLIPAAVVVFAARRKDPQLRALALLFVWMTLFWLLFTHLQARFFVLAIPIAALAIGSIHRPRWRWVVATVVILGTVPSLFLIAQKVVPLSPAMGIEEAHQLMTLLDMSETDAEAIETSDRPLVLAGDAKAFLFPLAKGRLHYRTVFDVDAKYGQSIVDAWTVGTPTDAIILVTPSELERFHKTYAGIPEAANLQSPHPYLMRR